MGCAGREAAKSFGQVSGAHAWARAQAWRGDEVQQICGKVPGGATAAGARTLTLLM